MGSLALAGVRMAAESAGVMVLPAAWFREISLTEGAPWAIRRSCGSLPGPPTFTFPSCDPVPITSHSEGLGAAPLSMGTGLWILQGPIQPLGLSSSITVLHGKKARGRVCQQKALPLSLWTSI